MTPATTSPAAALSTTMSRFAEGSPAKTDHGELGVREGVATGNGGGVDNLETDRSRVDRELVAISVGDLDDRSRSGGGELIKIVVSVNNPHTFRIGSRYHVGYLRCPFAVRHTQHLASYAAGMRYRSKDVEDRRHSQLRPSWANMAHCRMMCSGKGKPQSQLIDGPPKPRRARPRC